MRMVNLGAIKLDILNYGLDLIPAIISIAIAWKAFRSTADSGKADVLVFCSKQFSEIQKGMQTAKDLEAFQRCCIEMIEHQFIQWLYYKKRLLDFQIMKFWIEHSDNFSNLRFNETTLGDVWNEKARSKFSENFQNYFEGILNREYKTALSELKNKNIV